MMEEIEVTAQAKQAAMLAVMAAGDASNDKVWRNKVQANLAKFAALVRDDYGYWGREAQGIIDAQVFTATYLSHELEETSTRLVLQLKTTPSRRYPDGVEPIRTERTDIPPGWHMQRRVEALEAGQEIVVWKKMESTGADTKVRVLAHFEPVRSKTGGGERASNRPSARPEGDAPPPSSPSERSSPVPSEGQLSAEAGAVQKALADMTTRQRIAAKNLCVGEGIENWTDPGPEQIDRVLTLLKGLAS
jgi:hypothetical protein